MCGSAACGPGAMIAPSEAPAQLEQPALDHGAESFAVNGPPSS